MPNVLAITLDPARVQLQQGGAATAAVTVKNRSEEVEHYTLTLDGLPEQWGDIRPAQLSAFPFQESKAEVSVHPPAGAAGAIYQLTVCVQSQERPDIIGRAVLEVELIAPAAPAAAAAPAPAVASPAPAAPIDPTQQMNTVPRTAGPLPVTVTPRPLADRPPAERPPAGPAQAARPQIAAQIELRVEPVQDAALPPPARQWKLRVRNAGNVLDTFSFSFSGINPYWVAIDPVELQLNPLEEGTARMTVKPGAEASAGAYPFILRAFSHVNFNERTEVALKVEVAALAGFQLEINPRDAETQGFRDYQVALSSLGSSNSDLLLDLSASDQDNACSYTFQPREVLLPARQQVIATLRVAPRAVLGPGERKQYTFKVEAVPRQGAAPRQAVEARLTQTGLAPVSLGLQPQMQSAGMEADYVVQLANPSSVAINVQFNADDPELACDYIFQPDHRNVPARGASSVRLKVKAHAANKSGGVKPIQFTVKVFRAGDLLPFSTATGTLNQQPVQPITLALEPPQQSQPGAAHYIIRVGNPYAVPIQVAFQARDETDALEFRLTPPTAQIAPGGTGLIKMLARPKDKLTPGEQRRLHKFGVSALMPGDAAPVMVNGTLAQVPGADFSGSFGGFFRLLLSIFKMILRFLRWALVWIIVLLVLVFLANLAIAGADYVMTHDSQLGPILGRLVSPDLVSRWHETMLFRFIADPIISVIADIMQVVQGRLVPAAKP